MEGALLLNDIVKVIKKYIWLILLCVVLGGIGGKLFSPSAPPPTFQASSLVLIQNTDKDIDVNTGQNQDYARFLNTAATLIETPVVLDQVKQKLSLEMSVDKLADYIKVTNENNSEILRITVEMSDAETANKVAANTASIFKEEIGDYLDIKRVEIVKQANDGDEEEIVSETRTNASIMMGVIVGLVIGSLLVYIINAFRQRKG